MSVQKRDSLPPNIVKPQGDQGMNISESPRQESHSALGDTSAHGDLQGYRAKQQQYGAIGSDGGAAGMGVGYPCDLSTTGTIPADSNLQPETTTGGTDHLVVRKGGADDQTNTGLSGGRSLL